MYPRKCIVAVCQFTATNNKANNLKIVKNLVCEAASKSAKIVFLPEGCDFIGSNHDDTKALAEPLSGPLMCEYQNLAKSEKVWLSVGGFHELASCGDDERKCFNSHVLIDCEGAIQAVYKKVHLFDVSIPEENINLMESNTTLRGPQIVAPVNTPAGLLALSICYDLRFPELSILQRKQGARILTFPSAFTYATGLHHWEPLLKARAIENQCYVIAAAQYGQHNAKRKSFGQALIVDPWGQILAECPKYDQSKETESNASIAIAEIDQDFIEKTRQSMPVFKHRRDDLYQLECSRNIDKIAPKDDENFMFADKIIPGSTVFYRTRHSFAFTNIRCVVPGHVLIASLRQVPRLANLSQEEVSDLFQTAVKVQKVMEETHSSTSSTVCVQDGQYAGQTVPHVHVHILPRQPSDFPRNDDIYEKLALHDRENNPEPVRCIEEMSKEARKLRKYFQ